MSVFFDNFLETIIAAVPHIIIRSMNINENEIKSATANSQALVYMFTE